MMESRPETPINLRSRYLGPSYFTERHKDVFFGRDQDIANLVRLIEDKNQVLLYSKSGRGKTSLINAGLMQVLKTDSRVRNLEPIVFGNYVPEGMDGGNTEFPLEKIQKAVGNAIPAYLNQLLPDDKSLWARFKGMQLEGKSRFVLILDQFEQFFTYHETEQIKLAKELAELVHPYIPNRFQRRMHELEESDLALSDDNLELLYEPMRVHILVAIREDRLGDILKLNNYLPDLRHNYLELGALSAAQARQAIESPASAPGDDFISEPFTYEQAATDRIIAYLSSKVPNSIEPILLQIICLQVEERRRTEFGTNAIFPESRLPSFLDVMGGFYDSVLIGVAEKVAEEVVMNTRKFVEGQMIFGSNRIPVAEQVCEALMGKDALEVLKSRHLIRSEHQGTYELSHDTLVEPILVAKRKREAKEAVLEAAREKAKQDKANEEEREKQRVKLELEKERESRERERRQLQRTRMALLVAIFAALSAVFLLLTTIRQTIEANEAELDAKRAEETADSTTREVAKLEEEKRSILDGSYFYSGRFGLSFMIIDGVKRFGYIDQDRKVRIPYQFDEASSFDRETGFAVVKKREGPEGRLIEYLLDTNGTQYRLAYDLSVLMQMPNEIEALDLRNNTTNQKLRFQSNDHLKILLLDRSELNSLPIGVGQLRGLIYLGLSKNDLDEIPNSIGNLKKLQSLNLEFNKLTFLPSNFGELEELKSLRLFGNRLGELPSSFGRLKKLVQLDLRRQDLGWLTEDNVRGLQSLQVLNLSENHLSTLPKEIVNLKMLEEIDLSHNKIKNLPDFLTRMRQLRRLSISSNPCVKNSAQIIEIMQKLAVFLPNCQVDLIPISSSQIEEAVRRKGYDWSELGSPPTGSVNIVGIRNMIPGDTVTDLFDDWISITYQDSAGTVAFKIWPATTDPGVYFVLNPLNSKGCARIVPGQYEDCFELGYHQAKQNRQSLIQRKQLKVWRDGNKDSIFDPTYIEEGIFGLGIIRSSSNSKSEVVDRWSAGDQVFQRAADFEEFIEICKAATALSRKKSFTYTLLESTDIK